MTPRRFACYIFILIKWRISMENNNILSAGIEQLNEIKENLQKLNENTDKSKHLKEETEKLEKAIKKLEKDVADEISQTIKKRRGEIENTFDKEINKIKDKAKKVKEQRNKAKNLKVSERIVLETAELRKENNNLRLEAKTIVKQERLPLFCNSKLYQALYYPSCFTDFLLIILALAIVLLLIPCGIYFYLLPENKIVYLVLSYVATVIVFGSIYLAIGNITRNKYLEKILQIREIRKKIRANKKKISAIKRRIKRDRDESGYDLNRFDDELAALDKSEDEILSQKKEALTVFDNVTSKVIANEIQELHKDKLDKLKIELENAKDSLKQTEEKIKALTIKIASEYEPFLGKDLMTLDRLETLSNIILAGNATNISEAIAYYKQNTIPEKGNAGD